MGSWNLAAVRAKRPSLRSLVEERGLVRWKEWAEQPLSRGQVGLSLQKVGRGLYAAPGRHFEPSVIIAKRVPHGVLCLLTAAHFHGLLEEPPEVWLAIAHRARKPRVLAPPLRTVRFSGQALTEGIEQHCRWGVPVRVYSAAKTVVDLFKYRLKLGHRPAAAALRRALWLGLCTAEQVRHFARVCRVERVLTPYLEAAARLPVLPEAERFVESPRCTCHPAKVTLPPREKPVEEAPRVLRLEVPP